MSFGFWHSRQDEEPIKVPAIGLEVRVCLPHSASGGELAIIETQNEPGFGPPLHRHSEPKSFGFWKGAIYSRSTDGVFMRKPETLSACRAGQFTRSVNVADTSSRQLVLFLPGLDAAAFFGELAIATKGGVNKAALDAFGAKWASNSSGRR